MVDVAQTHSYKDAAFMLARAIATAGLAQSIVQVARTTDSTDPLGIDYWNTIGVLRSGGDIMPNFEEFEDRSGSPEGLAELIKTGQSDKMDCTIAHPTLIGWQLAYGNEITPTVTVAADGQTTVASSTNLTTTVLTSGSNIEALDTCQVIHSSFLKELAFITSKTTNTVTHQQLSQTPIASTPFQKILGATLTAAGIKFTSGGASFPLMKVRIIRFFHPSRAFFVQYRPEARIKGGGFKFNTKELMTFDLSMSFLDQRDATNANSYGNDWYIPIES